MGLEAQRNMRKMQTKVIMSNISNVLKEIEGVKSF